MVDMMDQTAQLSPPRPFLCKKEFILRFDLVEWTFAKCQDYAEPERKGIPRDEKRPIPRKKFMAEVQSLVLGNWTLRNMKLLASRVGISYTLSRKWASESEFKKGVRQLRDEYLDEFLALLVKMLKELNELAKLREKTDSELGLEAANFYYLAVMIELADYTWGSLMQQRAHEKIEEALRTLKIGKFAGFLRFLDLICHARSKGKIKVSPDYTIQCRDELDHFIQRLHWDGCVASFRAIPLTANAYFSAQATLSRLAISRLCGMIARGKQKEKLDTGAMLFLDTPTRYEALHLPQLE